VITLGHEQHKVWLMRS